MDERLIRDALIQSHQTLGSCHAVHPSERTLVEGEMVLDAAEEICLPDCPVCAAQRKLSQALKELSEG